VLDALRQPLETGQITVPRAAAHATYPARFQLVAAMNPCRCGHLGTRELQCAKAPRCADDYMSRISGPLFDRIDLVVEVPAVQPSDLMLPAPTDDSATVAARVAAAREIQSERFARAGRPELRTNAEAQGEILDEIAPLEPTARQLLERAAKHLHLTARSWHRVVRVARTIADLDGSDIVRKAQIAEALAFRRPAPRRS
jgi:magnesium chelatase family protein